MSSRRANSCKVAIVGAGPYGLSVAAHLKHAGISTRVFGEPMSFWRDHMPKGMKLRSPWPATHISDVGGAFTLDDFAASQGVDVGKLLAVEDFIAYGRWFQAHVVPDVDRRAVRRVTAKSNGFELDLDDDETFISERVVIATGLNNQEYRPPAFAGLPGELVSHTCEHADFEPFRGRRVAVIGRGQSACESAALLAEAGAEVELLCRGDIRWLGISASDVASRQSPFYKLHGALAAPSAVGPLPLSWLAEFPGITTHIPGCLRNEFNRRCLKAGAAGWLRPRFKNVSVNAGRAVVRARETSGRIVLEHDCGESSFDHAFLGTGYRIDISRIGVLAPSLLEKVARIDGSPVLGRAFDSSVPKLHFVGAYAVMSFGPLLRFIAGAPFAARTVAAVLADEAPAISRGFAEAIAPIPDRVAPNPSPPR